MSLFNLLCELHLDSQCHHQSRYLNLYDGMSPTLFLNSQSSFLLNLYLPPNQILFHPKPLNEDHQNLDFLSLHEYSKINAFHCLLSIHGFHQSHAHALNCQNQVITMRFLKLNAPLHFNQCIVYLQIQSFNAFLSLVSFLY